MPIIVAEATHALDRQSIAVEQQNTGLIRRGFITRLHDIDPSAWPNLYVLRADEGRTFPLEQESTLSIETLDARIAAIIDEHPASFVDGD